MVILDLWPLLYLVQSSVSFVKVGKYYIVTSNVVSSLYSIETVFLCTGMFPLPCYPLPTKKWGFSSFGIPLYLSKINCWFCTFLYFFIWIEIKIYLIIFFLNYYPFNLTCLLTISHSDFSKCCMIHTIAVWTKVLAIKCMSLYMNWLDIIILLFTPFEMSNTYLYSTH